MEKVVLLITLCGLSFSSMAQRTFEMQEGDTTYVMKEYFICFLYKGENAADIPEEKLEEIQA